MPSGAHTTRSGDRLPVTPSVTGHPDRIARLSAHRLPVANARFVDGARAECLERLGISTIGDLVRHFPFRYLDLTRVESLVRVRPGDDATVVGRVHEVKVKKVRPRLSVTEVALVDGTGVILGVWFNQPWVSQRFAVGERVAFSGKVTLDYGLKKITSPFFEKLAAEDDAESAARILPVHRSTDGLTTGWLRRLVAAAVDDFADIPDHLPASLRIKRDLVSLGSALRGIHFPDSIATADSARHRLAYDELLLLQLYMAMRRHSLTRENAGIAHVIEGPHLRALREAIPFELTADQARATEEILNDMAEPRPMNRLLLGDVGTGKTVVAAQALACVADSGAQAAMMAPTEVLATQYAEKVGPLLDAADIRWGLLTGSTSAARRRELLRLTADGSLSVLFGTHALLEQAVTFSRLSLAIVDEQHRFGVNQRLGLRGKGASADLLVMTATPIPRSLALTLYGDLASSYLRERPNASAGVTTHLVKPHTATPAHTAVRNAVAQGQQAYVVCSLVDESDAAQAKAATREADRLANQVFPDLKVGLLTGRMRPAEKAAAMAAFRSGETDVLVVDHRDRGRRRRAQRDGDDHRRRGPIRFGAAAPASRAGRARIGARGGAGWSPTPSPPSPRRGLPLFWHRPTGSSWPRRTFSCGARGTCSGTGSTEYPTCDSRVSSTTCPSSSRRARTRSRSSRPTRTSRRPNTDHFSRRCAGSSIAHGSG